MRILVVGAGATGGYFGARLAQAGQDVTFLVRAKRAEALQQNGLQIISPHGDISLRPNVVLAGEIEAPFDLIILTIKSFGLASALDDIAPAVGENTLIMPVLNGMRHFSAIEARFGREKLIGGMCKINAMLDEQGRIQQLTPLHQLFYGELSGEQTARIIQLDGALLHAGFDAQRVDSIVSNLWEKWLYLASLGAITCLMRGNTGQVVESPGGEQFVREMVREVLATIKSAGYAERDGVAAQTEAVLTQRGVPQTSSMYRDMMLGYALEADHILGDLCRYAADARLHTPLLNAAYTCLSVYQLNRNE